MEALFNGFKAVVNFYWGIPILFVLILGGIFLTLTIGGIQFTKFGYIMKHTFGSLFDREEQKRLRAKGVAPSQAVIAALGTTIGTGNIMGVAAAIATGGPGALFWMWVCGFLAMGIKYSEVLLSCNYREKNEEEGGRDWLAGAYQYIRKGVGSKLFAFIFGLCFLFSQLCYGATHASNIATNIAFLGVPKAVSAVVCLIVMVPIIYGGAKILVKFTDVIVPVMTGLFIVGALVVIFANIGSIGSVLVLIFKGAFTGTAAFGGFTGATLAATIRYGLSRGVFSNDAGVGAQAILHAQTEEIEHPAKQAIWAVFETFVDTIVVCSLTGFTILFSGVWTTGISSDAFTSSAFQTVLGNAGYYVCIVATVLFAISSLMGTGEIIGIQSFELSGSKTVSILARALFLVLVVIGSFMSLGDVLVFVDCAVALCLTLNIITMILLRDKIRSLTQEWFAKAR